MMTRTGKFVVALPIANVFVAASIYLEEFGVQNRVLAWIGAVIAQVFGFALVWAFRDLLFRRGPTDGQWPKVAVVVGVVLGGIFR